MSLMAAVLVQVGTCCLPAATATLQLHATSVMRNRSRILLVVSSTSAAVLSEREYWPGHT